MTTGTWGTTGNADGLYIEYGTTKATTENVGEYKTYGDMREVNVRIPDLTLIGSGATVLARTLKFPAGVRIARVDVIADTAATGTNAVLNIGLIKDDLSTELDYNGLVAAIPVTSIDAAGETTSLTAGATYAGALLGTTLTDVGGYLTADYDTAAFTAGALNVRIFYYGRGTITQ